MCLETSNTIRTAALLQVFQVPCHACMHATLPAIAGMQASSKTECKHSPLYCRQASECTIHNGIGTMHASCMLSNSKRSDFERFKTSSSCTYACMQPFFSACRFAVALSSQSNSCHAYATTSDHRVVQLAMSSTYYGTNTLTHNLALYIPGIEVPKENNSVQSRSLSTNLTSFCSADMFW